MNLGWRPDEMSYVLGHCSARGIVVEAQLLPTMSEAMERVSTVTDVIVTPGMGNVLPMPGLPGRTVLTLDELTAGADSAEPARLVADRDPLTYLYTSGTTSFPKGVVGNHAAVYLEP